MRKRASIFTGSDDIEKREGDGVNRYKHGKQRNERGIEEYHHGERGRQTGNEERGKEEL